MVKFFQEFWIGLQSYILAIKFIHQHRLYWYFLIPAILMLLIYQVGNTIINQDITHDLTNMNGIVWYFIQVAITISISLLLMRFTKYIVVILLSPLLSHISQKCEKLLTGATYNFSLKQIIRDVKRGIRLSLRNILFEYFFFLIIVIIATIGWGKPEQSPLFYITFIIGFYFYGFSFIDYNNERRKLDERESIYFVRSHRGLAMGIGMVYSLLILVPVNLTILFSVTKTTTFVINDYIEVGFHLLLWICASIAPILAIVSATLAMNKIETGNPQDFTSELPIDSFD